MYKSLYLSVKVFSTASLIVDTEICKQILKVYQKLFKNPSWREADQLAINRQTTDSRPTDD